MTEASARCGNSGGYRQLYPRQANLKVEPLADELVGRIVEGTQDPRLRWLGVDQVRVEIGRIIPAGSAVRETLAGRRRRLKNALRECLRIRGWTEMIGRLNTFQREGASS